MGPPVTSFVVPNYETEMMPMLNRFVYVHDFPRGSKYDTWYVR